MILKDKKLDWEHIQDVIIVREHIEALEQTMKIKDCISIETNGSNRLNHNLNAPFKLGVI